MVKTMLVGLLLLLAGCAEQEGLGALGVVEPGVVGAYLGEQGASHYQSQ